jgi:hypothetical protein
MGARDGPSKEGEMPAEKVYGIQAVLETPDGEMARGVSAGVPIVDVRWNREGGYVQIVSKETDSFGGRLVGDDPGSHVTDGYYVDLDRNAINDLIRNLRRARDQAFGKDE